MLNFNYSSRAWSRSDTTTLLVKNFLGNQLIAETLSISPHKIHPQSRNLSTPVIRQEDCQYLAESATLLIDITNVPTDGFSASSIGSLPDVKLTGDDLRKFIHDYTFDILADTTDQPLHTAFPRLGDRFDNVTPDLILNGQDYCLILEFATTHSQTSNSYFDTWNVKRFRYEKAIRDRVAKVRADRSRTDVKFGFGSIVVGRTCVLSPEDVNIPQPLINELCARFRFSSEIMDIAVNLGHRICESSEDQLKQDIGVAFSTIDVKWDELNRTPCKVKFTKERIYPNLSEDDLRSTSFKQYARCMRNAKDVLERSRSDDQQPDVHQLVEDHILGSSFRCKKVLSLPGGIPVGSFSEETYNDNPSNHDLMDDFITRVHMCMSEDHWQTLTEEEHERLSMLDEDDPELQEITKDKRFYRRIKVDLSEEIRQEFAILGVQAKSWSSNSIVSEVRRSKKEGLSYNSEINDIEDFLSATMKNSGLHVEEDLRFPLIKKALNMNDGLGFQEVDNVESLLLSDLGQWCGLISKLGLELSISLKQNVKHDEFIFKEVIPNQCRIIIKPTRMESHIFFTVLYAKSRTVIPDGIAQPVYPRSSCESTQWLSASVGKLVNWVKAEANLVNFYANWCRHYSVLLEDGLNHFGVMYMTKLSLLVSLEDKPRTEEIMSLTRYICMDKFSILPINPIKMLDKIPQILRSRLQVWAIKKLVLLMLDGSYYESKESVSDDGKATRRWGNMINPYTREELQDPLQLVECFYVGYATNKDAKSWDNTEFDLVKKIVKYEELLSEVRLDRMGMSSNFDDDYKFHEWDRDMVCAAGDAIKRQMRRMYGTTYYNGLDRDIVDRLARITWEDVATLKASSNFIPGADSNINKWSKIHTIRTKALIRILQEQHRLLDTPALSVPLVLKEVRARGGLYVDIFKKNQHGGLREIYVLDIHSRLLQLCIEEIAKAVSTNIPMEMMLHPSQKLRMPQEHMYSAAKNQSEFKLNISSSNDAKVWNQGHHVAKFTQFLGRFLPKKWMNFMIMGLDLWTHKNIRLPDGVLHFLGKQPETDLWDNTHTLIRDASLGLIKRDWLHPNQEYLVIETGMMQGILHYLSSLFHCGLLMLRQEQWERLSATCGVDSIATDMVSSDDSSRLLDVFAHTESQAKVSYLLAKLDHAAIEYWSPLFGVYMSPKSTIGTAGVMEFNSEFFFRASLHRPVLKWGYAALNLVETESFTERFEVCYNLVSSLLESGAGFKQTHVAQIAQALLHYDLLGLRINPLKRLYVNELLKLPDPALGFFPMDNPLAVGIGGVNYQLWNLVQQDPNYNKAFNHLLKSGDVTTTTLGQITRGAQIRFGNRQKIKKLIEESANVVGEGWREEIEDDPGVLYMIPRDLRSVQLKIMVKLTSPNVISSLSKGNSVSRMVSSSVYAINKIATTLGSNWVEAMQIDHGSSRKKSLLRLIRESQRDGEPLNDEDMKTIFPHNDQYMALKEGYRRFDDATLANRGSRKSLRSNILVCSEPTSLPFSLEKMCRYRWFGQHLPASKTLLNEVWEVYQRVYPWLQSTPKETLNHPDCHMESQIQLRNFIARQTTNSRMLHITGAPVRDSSSQDLVFMAIKKNQMRGWTLIHKNEENLEFGTSISQLVSHISSVMSFPFLEDAKADKVKTILRQYTKHKGLIWDGEAAHRPSGKVLQLSIIQKFLQMKDVQDEKDIPLWRRRGVDLENAEFTKYLRFSKIGVYGAFTKRQLRNFDEHNTWSGYGVWTGVVGSCSCQLVITDNNLSRVVTNSISALRESELLLSSFLKDIGVVSYSTDYTGNKHFDLRSVRADMIGAPIYENSALDYISSFSLTHLDIITVDNKLILSARATSGGSRYQLITFKTTPRDAKFNKKITESNLYLTSWINNWPLPIRNNYARDFLINLKDRKCPRGVSYEGLLTLVTRTLMHSLLRFGIDPNGMTKHQLASNELDNQEVVNLDEWMTQVPSDLLGDIDFLNFSDEDLDTTHIDPTLEQGIEDFLLGEVDITGDDKLAIDIYRYHRYWDEFSQDLSKDLSLKDKILLKKGRVNFRMREIWDLLSHFFPLIEVTSPISEVGSEISIPSLMQDWN